MDFDRFVLGVLSMENEFTWLSKVNFKMFRDVEKKKVCGYRWKIEVDEDRKGAKSFKVTAHGVESWFSFSKYGLKQAVKFIKEKAEQGS